MRTLLLTTVLTGLLACPLLAGAAIFGASPEKSAREAVEANLPAVTVWVEATWGFRKSGAANSLSQMHKAYAAHGYKVVDVQPYIENGDLQGFFVTYQKP